LEHLARDHGRIERQARRALEHVRAHEARLARFDRQALCRLLASGSARLTHRRADLRATRADAQRCGIPLTTLTTSTGSI